MEKLPQTVNQFDKLMMLEKIEPRDLEDLKPDEKNAFMDTLYEKLSQLCETPRMALVEKTIGILDNDFVWEYNHTKILEAIKGHIYGYGTPPNNSQLAAGCGLSRKTVRQHLKTFNISELWIEQKQSINIMRQNVIGVVMKGALKGDLKAAKLYLETTKETNESEFVVNNQSNYIQINKTVINQQVIQQLKPEQLHLIEQIIAGNGSKADPAI